MATIEELRAELAALQAKRDEALAAQSYSTAGRSVVKVDFSKIDAKIAVLESRIARKQRGSATAPVFIQTR